MRDEVQSSYDFVVPGGMVKVRNQGGNPDNELDGNDLCFFFASGNFQGMLMDKRPTGIWTIK